VSLDELRWSCVATRMRVSARGGSRVCRNPTKAEVSSPIGAHHSGANATGRDDPSVLAFDLARSHPASSIAAAPADQGQRRPGVSSPRSTAARSFRAAADLQQSRRRCRRAKRAARAPRPQSPRPLEIFRGQRGAVRATAATAFAVSYLFTAVSVGVGLLARASPRVVAVEVV
jgi:hypothetical protein